MIELLPIFYCPCCTRSKSSLRNYYKIGITVSIPDIDVWRSQRGRDGGIVPRQGKLAKGSVEGCDCAPFHRAVTAFPPEANVVTKQKNCGKD